MVSVFDLASKLPGTNEREDQSGDLASFMSALQGALDLALADHDRFKNQNNPDEADENAVNAMLFDLGNPFNVALSQPLARRRLLVRVMIKVYLAKGTPPGLADALRALTGLNIVNIIFPAQTVEAWDLGFHVLGDGTVPGDPNLTDEAVLGSTPGRSRFSFQVEIDQALTSDSRAIATEIIELTKPAHTHFIGFIEPFVGGPTIEHWEIGVSELDGAVESDISHP